MAADESTAQYKQIAQDLQRQIEQGVLGPGDRLPSEEELAAQWAVSRNTVKAAIKELTKRERVKTIPKVGSFVTEDVPPFVITLNHTDLGEDEGPGRAFGGGEGRAFVTEARRQNHSAHSSKPSVEIITATEMHIKALKIPPAGPDEDAPDVVCRFQKRFIDDKPNSMQWSYFTWDLGFKAKALVKSVDITEGTVAYLRNFDHVQVGYEDVFEARPPTPEEAEFFGLPKDSLAVIVHRRTAYDQNGEPFRLTVTVYKPGSNKFRFIAGDVPEEVWKNRPTAQEHE
ncbi:GntR family transcriptional regulator [Actinomadura sp. WMMB 499]|uniref:GntR family transcriptional regulator n=1 Tax=Actinomadura sp. WMMB 499 TaxID=1219491 RepID=UPI00124406E2|nr:GntR family transcriptional regulator [Actinomadura sp. WMMB 499]QFG25304.1 GntR family transcriptional regulator [Actinomadura sp. WMMB 499]